MRIRLLPEIRHWSKVARHRSLSVLVPWAIGFILATGALILHVGLWGEGLDLFVLRSFFQLRGPRPVSDSVVIVTIDDPTYIKLNASTNSTLPRRYMAQALERIVQAHPKLIILDAKAPNERDVDPSADQRIVAALKAGPTTLWDGITPADRLNNIETFQGPIDEQFYNAAKLKLPMSHHLIRGTVVRMVPGSMDRVLTELAHVPIIKPPGQALINYYGIANTLPRISFYRLTDQGDEEAARELTGKIVLIGYQSIQYAKIAEGDHFQVPNTYGKMFGVEIHATIANNLLDGSWFQELPTDQVISLIFIFTLAMAAFAVIAPIPLTLVLITIGYLSLVIGSYIAFSRYHFWIAGIGTLGIAYVVALGLGLAFMSRKGHNLTRKIKKMFNFEIEPDA